MLDAFIKKNVRRILSRKGDEHSINKHEDAVTSMIFSPLKFMASGEALECFKILLGRDLADRLPSRPVRSLDLDLWPRGLRAPSNAIRRMTRCEPDLVATVEFEKGRPLIIIGEMKWESYPSGDDLRAEVEREGAAVRAEHPTADLLVFALVTYAKVQYARLPFRVIPWADFRRSISDYLQRSTTNSPCRRWAADVSEFLAVAEGAIFAGITQEVGSLPDMGPEPIFYRSGFCGFSNANVRQTKGPYCYRGGDHDVMPRIRRVQGRKAGRQGNRATA